ncbi:MAG: hypothetical protein GY856_33310 [bacterium]|nr:hypothetical protein [bacterium]
MTIVIADTEDQAVIFGADSAAGAGDEIYTLEAAKVFERDGFLFGHCGSRRIAQIVRHCVELPAYPEKSAGVERFLVRELNPAIRRAVEAEGVAGEGRGFLGDKTCILISVQGQIWCIGPDLTVTPEGPFGAIGSGRMRAYGALHALRAAGIKPARRRIELALEATAEYTALVRPPWRFVSSGFG